MLYLGTDHRGFDLKENIKAYLNTQGLPFTDLGAFSKEPDDDYPVYAQKVASAMRSDDKGILICGSGHGVCVAANKVKGIRASLVLNPESTRAGRRDDDLNIICLSADQTNVNNAQAIVETFLRTDFLNEERHRRRLNQIKDMENL